MNQVNYNDEIPQIIAPNEPHMACLLLLDVSGSMGYCSGDGQRPIDLLNEALNRFKTDVCLDKRTREILDIAIVTFDHETHDVQPWCPIELMSPVDLVPLGGTAFVPAVRRAIEMIDERVRFYRQAIGPNFYKPWIVMITDGRNEHGDPVDAIAAEVRVLDSAGKLSFWALGVDNYDPIDLHKLTDRVMRLKDRDFASFFDWVNKSMRSVSTSTPGERPQGVALPANVDKDTNEWM